MSRSHSEQEGAGTYEVSDGLGSAGEHAVGTPLCLLPARGPSELTEPRFTLVSCTPPALVPQRSRHPSFLIFHIPHTASNIPIINGKNMNFHTELAKASLGTKAARWPVDIILAGIVKLSPKQKPSEVRGSSLTSSLLVGGGGGRPSPPPVGPSASHL